MIVAIVRNILKENSFIERRKGKGGDQMSLEAIKKITETERLSLLRKAEAEQATKKTVAEAERAGKELLESARVQAEAQVKDLMAQAEKAAAEETQAVRKQTEQACQQLKDEAQTRLEDAAAWIVRRVVSV